MGMYGCGFCPKMVDDSLNMTFFSTENDDFSPPSNIQGHLCHRHTLWPLTGDTPQLETKLLEPLLEMKKTGASTSNPRPLNKPQPLPSGELT